MSITTRIIPNCNRHAQGISSYDLKKMNFVDWFTFYSIVNFRMEEITASCNKFTPTEIFHVTRSLTLLFLFFFLLFYVIDESKRERVLSK
jgi:hypothetical protein